MDSYVVFMSWLLQIVVLRTLGCMHLFQLEFLSFLDINPRVKLQFSSVAQSCLTLCDPMDCNSLGLSITNCWSLLKLISIKSVMPSNHLILCRPLFLLPSIFPSIRVFSNESVLCIRWPKYWSFSISPFDEY